ncbi:hypothetical protein LTR27_009937 [Elasticomyces elasticus]|nr:hypothetical protein LTR27_009937 [Elasticomyces elasticus]
MADVDSTAGGSRGQDLSMSDKMARYRQFHAEISKILAEYKLHVSSLLDHARKLTHRSEIILDSLNSGYEVKRITIAESGPLDFKYLVEEFVFASYPRGMSSNLHEAVVLESAMPLENLRAGAAGVAVKAMQLVRETQIRALDNEHLAAVEELLRTHAQLFAEMDISFRNLEERYDTWSECGRTFDSNGDWKADLESMRGRVSEATASILLAAPEDAPDTRYYQDAWEKIRLEVGAPLARSVVEEYEEMRAQYEATFASALKLAPEVFAYPGWCTADANERILERRKRSWQRRG